ncbi:MAG: AAA family ATPase [Coriobacteriia bacterium]|nr:AAA family ATPase [Coriobacteriia bacterium]
MDRYLMNDLVAWRDARRRKPLVLNGARQVGKTWLLKEFGRTQFEKLAYVSLDSNTAARALFDSDFDVRRIIDGLSLLTNIRIEPGNTLIVLDEVQSVPKAITALKYFCEEAPEYAVSAAGSLLGISAAEGSGFPVGKVDCLDLYPLSFREFLDATGDGMLRELLDSGDSVSVNAFKEKSIEALRRYCVVGGMPAVVEEFVESGDCRAARRLQSQILQDYERDFSKHIPMRLYARVREVWESIPAHLSHENKKFVFGRVREGARAKDFEEALVWLSQAGLIHKVPRVTKPGVPLSAYDDHKAFKVFLSDVGLLGAMSGLEPTSIVEGDVVFTEFKGALAEQYVCQQLISDCGMRPYYWSAENSSGEIDFLIQDNGRTHAIEVKAEENLQAKSLRAFKSKNPEVTAVRFSLSGYREQDWMRNVPLYAMGVHRLWTAS